MAREPRLTAIELELTDEQKRLIGQITDEGTGLVIAVRTDAESIPNEFGGLNATEADKRFVNILHESAAEVLSKVSGTALEQSRFASIIGIAAFW